MNPILSNFLFILLFVGGFVGFIFLLGKLSLRIHEWDRQRGADKYLVRLAAKLSKSVEEATESDVRADREDIWRGNLFPIESRWDDAIPSSVVMERFSAAWMAKLAYRDKMREHFRVGDRATIEFEGERFEAELSDYDMWVRVGAVHGWDRYDGAHITVVSALPPKLDNTVKS